MLLLGSTGKVIRPTNQNSGVASVASVTLQKLVVPLKSVMINDRELTFLREIVLFNPGKRMKIVLKLILKHYHALLVISCISKNIAIRASCIHNNRLLKLISI